MRWVEDTIVLAGMDADIAFASHSIIIAAGSIRIAHSENNIVVSGDEVGISHDGGRTGAGSLVVSKGRTRISHAHNTLIHALDGADVSHATNVRGFNTDRRTTSHGHIANIIMAPLFRQRSAPALAP